MYIKIEEDTIIENSHSENIEIQQFITEDEYIQNGWYKVIINPPEVDWPNYVITNPKNEWLIDNDNKTVTQTYKIQMLHIDLIKNDIKLKIEEKLKEKIYNGFYFDNKFWSISEEARLNYAGLYARIQAGRGLPNNATDIKISSLDHQRHIMTEQQVADLAERVSDYWASLMEVYADKMEEVTLSEDPMSVDIEIGWPI